MGSGATGGRRPGAAAAAGRRGHPGAPAGCASSRSPARPPTSSPPVAPPPRPARGTPALPPPPGPAPRTAGKPRAGRGASAGCAVSWLGGSGRRRWPPCGGGKIAGHPCTQLQEAPEERLQRGEGAEGRGRRPARSGCPRRLAHCNAIVDAKLPKNSYPTCVGISNLGAQAEATTFNVTNRLGKNQKNQTVNNFPGAGSAMSLSGSFLIPKNQSHTQKSNSLQLQKFHPRRSKSRGPRLDTIHPSINPRRPFLFR